jgi:hypothetical protein
MPEDDSTAMMLIAIWNAVVTIYSSFVGKAVRPHCGSAA